MTELPLTTHTHTVTQVQKRPWQDRLMKLTAGTLKLHLHIQFLHFFSFGFLWLKYPQCFYFWQVGTYLTDGHRRHKLSSEIQDFNKHQTTNNQFFKNTSKKQDTVNHLNLTLQKQIHSEEYGGGYKNVEWQRGGVIRLASDRPRCRDRRPYCSGCGVTNGLQPLTQRHRHRHRHRKGTVDPLKMRNLSRVSSNKSAPTAGVTARGDRRCGSHATVIPDLSTDQNKNNY